MEQEQPGAAEPLSDEQCDALMPEPVETLAGPSANGDGSTFIVKLWSVAQVRVAIRAALSTHAAPARNGGETGEASGRDE
jgi:hypothetical protein